MFRWDKSGLLLVALLCLCCEAFGCLSKSPPSSKYIGCYHDSESNRDLPREISGTSRQMSKEICEARCRDNGNKYFGLQGGEECRCGDSFGKYGKAEEDACDRNCNAKMEDICGGVAINSVHEIVY